MAFAHNGDVHLYYDTFGVPNDPTVLLVSGLGSQCINYKEEFCELVSRRGYFVVRYDNRDVGLSSRVHEPSEDASLTFQSHDGPAVPYTLGDMGDDGFAVLDALGVTQAHVVGTSMGGMIAQTMAIERPLRLRTLTSIMSTTGDRDVGQPTPEALDVLLAAAPIDVESFVALQLRGARTWGSPGAYDEVQIRRDSIRAFERSDEPAGFARQLKAIRASESRTASLASVRVPTLVVHGDADTLVDPSGGRRTAQAIPDAQFELVEGMGHDRPAVYWDRLVNSLVSHFARG